MDKTLIDIVTLDKDIENHLRETLHMQVGALRAPSDLEPGVQCYPFLCQKDPCYDKVKTLVANLATQISQNRLRPGNLLLFSTDQCAGSDSSIACFLGVVLKKPQQHMLLESLLHDADVSEVSLKSDERGLPVVYSSHEFFLRLLRSKSGKQSLHVSVQAWQCQVFLHEGHHIKSNPEKQIADFAVTETTSKPARIKRETVKLPFGLQASSRKRSKKPKCQPKPSKRSRGSGLQLPTVEPQHASSSSNASSSESSATDQEVADPEQETETVVPASATAQKEQQNLNKLAEEIQTMDSLKEEAAKKVHAPTFFTQELGLCEAALARSGRSVCMHCRQLIQNQSVRFSWYHSKVKPPGWLHFFCVVEYAQQADQAGATADKLESIIQSQSSSSSSREISASSNIVECARSILKALR